MLELLLKLRIGQKTGDTTAIPASKLTNSPAGGLNEAAVGAIVVAKVENWAETGDTTAIPASKLTNSPAVGPSGGLNQGAVDARIAVNVEDWAETGNTSAIPASKLTNVPASSSGLNEAAVDARIVAKVDDWAETGNTTAIPAAKLANAPAGSAAGRGIIVGDLPAVTEAVGGYLYGTGTGFADTLYWVKPIPDRKRIVMTAGAVNRGVVGWGTGTNIGNVLGDAEGSLDNGWDASFGFTGLVSTLQRRPSDFDLRIQTNASVQSQQGGYVLYIDDAPVTLHLQPGRSHGGYLYQSSGSLSLVVGQEYTLQLKLVGSEEFLDITVPNFYEEVPGPTPDAKLLPDLPSTGSRENKVVKFDGDVLGWEDDIDATPVAKLLPDLPDEGIRNNKIS